MASKSPQVMLPFGVLPTTDCVRAAYANVIRDIQREHDLTDLQLAERIGVHVNTIQRARNKLATLDSVAEARLGAAFGEEAMQPIKALWGREEADCNEPVGALADALSALSRAKGLKAEFDALPTVKDAIEALQAWTMNVERKRLRAVA